MKLIVDFFTFPDLSECSLIQVPDAVYHLMRHTEVKSCDLSGNAITKISPKFAAKFSVITGELKLDNRMNLTLIFDVF